MIFLVPAAPDPARRSKSMLFLLSSPDPPPLLAVTSMHTHIKIAFQTCHFRLTHVLPVQHLFNKSLKEGWDLLLSGYLQNVGHSTSNDNGNHSLQRWLGLDITINNIAAAGTVDWELL